MASQLSSLLDRRSSPHARRSRSPPTSGDDRFSKPHVANSPGSTPYWATAQSYSVRSASIGSIRVARRAGR